MRYVISGIGILAAVTLMAASGFMNFQFWITQGHTDRQSGILGAVSLAFDIFKALLPLCIAWAWSHGKRFYVIAGSVLFALFFSFSLLSAIGFAASNRGSVSAGRASTDLKLLDATHELDIIKAQLAVMGLRKSKAILEAELKTMQQDRFWKGSQGCKDPSGSEALAFCKRFALKTAELVTSQEGERLSRRHTELSAQIEALKGQGAGEGPDPQAGMLSSLLGLALETAQKVLVIFLAVLVELGAAFGLFLAKGHSLTENTEVSRRDDTIPSEPVLLPLSLPEPTLYEPAEIEEEMPVEVEQTGPLRLTLSKSGELVVQDRARSSGDLRGDLNGRGA